MLNHPMLQVSRYSRVKLPVFIADIYMPHGNLINRKVQEILACNIMAPQSGRCTNYKNNLQPKTAQNTKKLEGTIT